VGLRHPPPMDDVTPIDGPRRLIGLVSAVIFVITFVPAPLRINEPAMAPEIPIEQEVPGNEFDGEF